MRLLYLKLESWTLEKVVEQKITFLARPVLTYHRFNTRLWNEWSTQRGCVREHVYDSAAKTVGRKLYGGGQESVSSNYVCRKICLFLAFIQHWPYSPQISIYLICNKHISFATSLLPVQGTGEGYICVCARCNGVMHGSRWNIEPEICSL